MRLFSRALPANEKGEIEMRMWLLLILLICLASALYLGFGTSGYSKRSAEIVSQLEDM